MSRRKQIPSGPSNHDVVEVIDPRSGFRVSAAVEEVAEDGWLLHFDVAATIPNEAAIYWDDGDGGWQARARLAGADETMARFRVAPPCEWESAPARRSLRATVDKAPILIRPFADQSPTRQSLHTVCLDISDSGCRVAWPGPAPRVGDTVEVAREVASWRDGIEPRWIRARVVRVIALPFGKTQVGLRFDLADVDQAIRVRSWVHDSVQAHRSKYQAQF
jgi:hypothetical protein